MNNMKKKTITPTHSISHILTNIWKETAFLNHTTVNTISPGNKREKKNFNIYIYKNNGSAKKKAKQKRKKNLNVKYNKTKITKAKATI